MTSSPFASFVCLSSSFVSASGFVLAATLLACSGGGEGGLGAANDGGSATTKSPNAAACVVTIDGFEPQCQLYEASGADAPRLITQLRAECINQKGAAAHLVDACPTAATLGGCKTPVKVQGASDVKLFTTVFMYAPSADASVLAPKTAASVESLCKSQGATAVYVASP